MNELLHLVVDIIHMVRYAVSRCGSGKRHVQHATPQNKSWYSFFVTPAPIEVTCASVRARDTAVWLLNVRDMGKHVLSPKMQRMPRDVHL